MGNAADEKTGNVSKNAKMIFQMFSRHQGYADSHMKAAILVT